MSDMQAKFQQLLRELFQFDLADLDFGIYRIMNHKRQVIERWITEDLRKAIEQELQRGALADMQQSQQALEEARQKVLESLGQEAIDAEGNLAEPYHNTKVGQAYLEARERAAHAQPSEALEAAVYNHLYTFFSRYYQDGDFISKRRYSKKERYAIPYNGEEVYLYWANHDQYYVKTAEHFTDYTWKAPNGVTVHFKLQAADVEQGNVKGEKRFFQPVLNGIVWGGETRTLTIPFHYRPLTEQESIAYGKQKQQDKIIEAASEAIPARLAGKTEALAALSAERLDAKGNLVSYLEHHLRQYTARNTRDFFIHKDLKAFLSRELDFYLKNEVLDLDELEAAGEDLSESWFQLMRLIKRVGNHIIDFLAQIEDFQKALWQKKKFVTGTFWCITVGNIPEDFYAEIAQNEAQWQEWRALFDIHELPEGLFSGGLDTEEGRIAFIKSQPTLVVDTRHFSQGFTDRMLACLDNLDEMTDGLLVHSENWQALNLLLEKYQERVKAIYIDPPYNTAASEILYKNEYREASWLSMMADRIQRATPTLRPDGASVIAIDDTEMVNLSAFVDIFMPDYDRNVVVVNHHPAGAGLAGASISSTHEYALFLIPRDAKFALRLPKGSSVQEIGFMRTGTAISNLREGRPNSFYAVLIDEATGGVVGAEPPPHPGSNYPAGRTDEGYLRVYPIGADGRERVWRRSYESGLREIEKGNILCKSRNGKFTLYLRSEKKSAWAPVKSNWTDTKYNAGAYGSRVLTEVMGSAGLFSYPKSVFTVRDCILAVTQEDLNAPILDYFAGSGTTGHAVISLNREDGGRRRFILVEMGEYFDTVLLPRIKKVTFSPEWKDGKPKRTATPEEFARGPRIVKVIRLESYEDALNNITFDEQSGQQALEMFADEYLLRYMLRWESKKSKTFLEVEQLQSPFSYKLRIHRDGETREQPVDLPETFNYIIGLDVETRRLYLDDGRRYLVYRGATRDGRKVAVIWRETKGWTPEDYEQDAEFVAQNGLIEGVDEIYVNGDSFIPKAKSLDGLFKSRLFAPVEA